MVTNVTSLTGNGLKDWLIQRVSALVLLFYFVFLLSFFCKHPQLEYGEWQALFSQGWFQIISALSFTALTLHAWIGLWTVTTDYLTCTAGRLFVQVSVALWLAAQWVWCIMMIWGQ